jgi:PBP1b-binding outer membrane lipoprotein LpoB
MNKILVILLSLLAFSIVLSGCIEEKTTVDLEDDTDQLSDDLDDIEQSSDLADDSILDDLDAIANDGEVTELDLAEIEELMNDIDSLDLSDFSDEISFE